MNINKIDDIVKKVVNGRYEIKSHFSKTSNSYYVTVYNDELQIQMRFSDHLHNIYKHKKTKTFIYKRKGNEKQLENYVANRIKSLDYVSLHNTFSKLEQKNRLQN